MLEGKNRMILATDVKEGMTVRIDDRLQRVLEVVRHTGSGQMHGFIEMRLQDMRFGHFADRRYKHADRLEEVLLAKRQMEFLYADGESCYFMDPGTFEQVGVPKQSVGKVERFLSEGTKVTVELLGEEAVSIQFPRVIEMKIASTGPGIRGEGQDNTLKPAMLENGVEIQVPQFIVNGDAVRVDPEKAKYIDRVKAGHGR
jgi:elongation factor P